MRHPEIQIVSEDNDVVIVNKPAHFLTIPDRHNPDEPNLYHVLQQYYESIFIVHRLDAETSGILCFARNEAAHRALSLQFSHHSVTKTYRAIVHGRMLQTEGVIDAPIGEDPHQRGTMRVDYKMGKPALSRYRVLETFRDYSYVEVAIETGRTHQIRVHLKSLGFPLLGDKRYGGKPHFMLSSIKRRFHLKKNEDEQPILKRVALHAHALTFLHPTLLTDTSFGVPLHKDMDVCLKLLRKYGS
ncbi:MAG: RNA pseudouridine synthase [Sphingobacteriales bacterium]|nr:RNA pseudouridine synthase [Sphingobacteriales bacterium]MCC7224902.1 RNA pseudouridine synthase [Chitinophagales bacterium]